MFWKTLAQDQGHCHGGDHLDDQVQFLILLSSSESFSGELAYTLSNYELFDYIQGAWN
jgi:hypothetical protein